MRKFLKSGKMAKGTTANVTNYNRYYMRTIMPAILLSVVCTTGQADSTIRPGLWEVTTKSDLLGLVPYIPSEQMQQITSLARQYGLEIPHVQDGAVTSRVCITAEMTEQDIPSHFYEDQSGCTVRDASRTGNRYQVELVCDNSQFKGDGHAEGIFSNPENFTGRTEFNSTVQGTPVYVYADTVGRWVGEQCEAAQFLR